VVYSQWYIVGAAVAARETITTVNLPCDVLVDLTLGLAKDGLFETSLCHDLKEISLPEKFTPLFDVHRQEHHSIRGNTLFTGEETADDLVSLPVNCTCKLNRVPDFHQVNVYI